MVFGMPLITGNFSEFGGISKKTLLTEYFSDNWGFAKILDYLRDLLRDIPIE